MTFHGGVRFSILNHSGPTRQRQGGRAVEPARTAAAQTAANASFSVANRSTEPASPRLTRASLTPAVMFAAGTSFPSWEREWICK
jgi:hypothetical protein